jgi:hypothetical protein
MRLKWSTSSISSPSAVRVAAGARHLAVERLLEVAAVVRAGERVAHRLLPEPVAEGEVGERHGHVLAHLAQQREGLAPPAPLVGVEAPAGDVEHAQRLAVGGERQARVVAGVGRDVGAAEARVAGAHHVLPPAAQRAALLGGEREGRVPAGVAPAGHALDPVARRAHHGEQAAAGREAEQRGEDALDRLVRLGRVRQSWSASLSCDSVRLSRLRHSSSATRTRSSSCTPVARCSAARCRARAPVTVTKASASITSAPAAEGLDEELGDAGGGPELGAALGEELELVGPHLADGALDAARVARPAAAAHEGGRAPGPTSRRARTTALRAATRRSTAAASRPARPTCAGLSATRARTVASASAVPAAASVVGGEEGRVAGHGEAARGRLGGEQHRLDPGERADRVVAVRHPGLRVRQPRVWPRATAMPRLIAARATTKMPLVKRSRRGGRVW